MQNPSALFDIPATPLVSVEGSGSGFPVHRIFCVGRNYVAHAQEMGNEVDREAPFYFTKPASAIVLSGATIAYPPGTKDCHHEVELVVAMGKPAFRVPVEEALGCVYGYAVGIDLTRRDLQQAAKDKQRPWDLGKAFENSAMIGALTPAERFGAPAGQAIRLSINGTMRQEATLRELVWSVPEIISHLSRYYHLLPGDLIYTGTPAGVGPIAEGDLIECSIEGLSPFSVTIGPAE